MLSLLHIENIAVIESADISFDGGFTVLTGETGAGKSIVIDAISAILGERAYRDMIRTGANKATVRAVFTGVPKLQWFEDNGVEYDPETIVQREIFLDGKNVCRVNGSLVTVSILRKLGIQLINIHGQHDSASLFDEDNHLAFLDAFAGNEALRSDYGEKYETVAKLRREIDRLTMDEGEKLRRMETLKYQIAEIEKAELEPGEDERLEDRRKILQNAEKLSNGMETAVECLYGGDDTDGAAGLLAQAEYALARLSRFSDSFNALHERVADLMYQVQDAAEEVRDARDGLSYSADELEQIESRLDVIHKLRRKYGTTCEDILAYLDSARKELDDIEFADDHLERLKGKLQKAEKAAWDAAIALRENRKAAAKAMSERILTELTQLDMPRVQFSCEFRETELTVAGADTVAFYMSANAGEALKPMSKVASGGELARIMLAMKNVLAEKDQVETLIFDEVDTGVSGRAAQKVAQKLKSANLIRYPGLFKLYASFAVDEGEIQPGIWDLNTLYDYHALVNMMSPSSHRSVVTIMIPEGSSCRQIFELLQEKRVCTVEALESYAATGDLGDHWFLDGLTRGDKYCLEGYLFPDTYEFYTNDTAENVLNKMLNNFDSRVDESIRGQLDSLNGYLVQLMTNNGRDSEYISSHMLSMADVITVASLIEKESASAEESYTIASVIYNRLYAWGSTPAYLNIDAAVIYGLGGKTDLTQADLQTDTPYNTYLHTGLTPGPITNPGLNSIKAALAPQNTKYYYYILDPAVGTHHFSSTLEEHEAFREAIRG